MSAGVKRQMAHGAAWMMLFKLSERVLGLLSTLVLVRVLSPQDFGVVAMAMSFIAVAELVSAFGFDLALIHKRDATASHFNVAWTCNVLLGVAIMLVMLLAAKPITDFYGRPEVFWVVVALAFGPLIGGAENIGVVAFRRELDFRKEFRFLLTKKVLAVLITVPLALWLRSYWALIAGMLFSRTAGTVISYLLHPFRPRFALGHIGELMVFSRWILVNNVVTVFKERTTDFAIGASQGPHALGLYNVANEFANLPHTELAAPVNRALLPGFASIQDDRAAGEQAFIAAIRLLAFIVVPAAAIIHVVAPYLVPVLLGSKWLDTTPLMQVLALAGGTVAMHSPLCALLIAFGHPGRVALSHAFYVLVLFTALFALMPVWGVLGAAVAVLCAAVVSTPVYLYQVRRHVGIRSRQILRAVARPLAAAVVMVFAMRAMDFGTAAPQPGLLEPLLRLMLATVTGLAIHGAIDFALWFAAGRPMGAEQQVVERLAAFVATRRRVAH